MLCHPFVDLRTTQYGARKQVGPLWKWTFYMTSHLRLVRAGRAPVGYPHLFSPTPCGEKGFSFSRGLESKSFHRSLSDQEGLGGLLTHLSP